MPEVVLQSTGILSIIRQLIAASVTQHVRMNREGQWARLVDTRERLAKARRGHWRVPLGLEKVAPLGLVPSQPPQCSKLLPAERMNRRHPVLQPRDVQEPLSEIDLIPGERTKLTDPQAVAIGDQDHRRVPVPIAAPLLRRDDKSLDLGRRQVFARPPLAIAPSTWWPDLLAHSLQRRTFRRGPRLAICTVPFPVVGIVSFSLLIAVESLAWSGATVAFVVKNGTLPLREQTRSCLIKG